MHVPVQQGKEVRGKLSGRRRRKERRRGGRRRSWPPCVNEAIQSMLLLSVSLSPTASNNVWEKGREEEGAPLFVSPSSPTCEFWQTKREGERRETTATASLEAFWNIPGRRRRRRSGSSRTRSHTQNEERKKRSIKTKAL